MSRIYSRFFPRSALCIFKAFKIYNSWTRKNERPPLKVDNEPCHKSNLNFSSLAPRRNHEEKSKTIRWASSGMQQVSDRSNKKTLRLKKRYQTLVAYDRILQFFFLHDFWNKYKMGPF